MGKKLVSNLTNPVLKIEIFIRMRSRFQRKVRTFRTFPKSGTFRKVRTFGTFRTFRKSSNFSKLFVHFRTFSFIFDFFRSFSNFFVHFRTFRNFFELFELFELPWFSATAQLSLPWVKRCCGASMFAPILLGALPAW